MSRLKKAAERAQQWLQNVNTESSQMIAMREIGLWFCERIYLGKNVLMLRQKSGGNKPFFTNFINQNGSKRDSSFNQ